MQLTLTEENYLKAIYSIQITNKSGEVSVNEIAERMQTRPATVTDMLKKFSEKSLVHYEKYKKVKLSEIGLGFALQIVRKHRLWETFLHDTLNFSWDEVHEVAEQLEHIHSQKLIDRLDAYLDFPKFDPHGDPIPNAKGVLPTSSSQLLSATELGEKCTIVAVKDTSINFLQQLEKLQLQIGTTIMIEERMPFDKSIIISIDNVKQLMLSEKIANNIIVTNQ